MESNTLNGTKSREDRDPVKDLKIEINGTAAELFVAKLYNCYFDLSIGVRIGGTDLTIKPFSTAYTVDVKSTSYEDGKIQVPLYKKVTDSDAYILVHVDFPKCTIVGGIMATELFQDFNIVDGKFGKYYTKYHDELYPLDQLFIDELPF